MSQAATARPLETATPSRAARRAGYVMQGLVTLFLAFDSIFKFFPHEEAIKGTVGLGWPEEVLPTIGTIGLVCLALYLIPRTAIFGALLWTGYLGGAVATHVRIGNPLATHTLFPIYVALLLWGALWLREERLRALLPLRAPRS